MDVIKKTQDYSSKEFISKKTAHVFLQLYAEYQKAIEKSGASFAPHIPFFLQFLEDLKEQKISPFFFEPYHKQIRKPFDYYQFGLDFIRPLIDLSKSSVTGLSQLEEISQKIKKKENVIFLANHQIEADPQVISILLEKEYASLAQDLIFVAGERVLTDPLAIPFSKGRNLLCIYSKRHIDNPPEQKTKKQLHNKKTMELMRELLCEGGHAIYVAPSGGRDRADANGKVQIAKFDPQSIEMFCLMAKKATNPTSFYPMALATYKLLPPPDTVQSELGEERKAGREAAHLWIGPKISMDNFPGSEESDKKTRRELRANFIWSLVEQAYGQFPLN